MVEKELLFIRNNEIELEAEYFQSKSNPKNPVVLICHPHPQYGGNMYNNVVSGVFNKLIKNDISCLRFNFRGVGRSTGNHSVGTKELSDVHTCIDFLINDKKCERIIICGYSYGAAIGCSAINHSNRIIGYISISFPWDFMDSKYRELSQSNKPKLFIQGNQDTIALYERFEENFNYYLNPKVSKIIDGADHFYWGYEEQVSNEVVDFYNSII
ncbi:MAG: alpha/beta hydrolase [Candidatus Hodarchaeota archaeon]